MWNLESCLVDKDEMVDVSLNLYTDHEPLNLDDSSHEPWNPDRTHTFGAAALSYVSDV